MLLGDMMLTRNLIILSLMTSPALADQAEDKAEFKKLYAEFNELYANSEAIDPIIEVGEKLYKLAPTAYGKGHANTAVVTYNLATLYDEKGEEKNNKFEERAFELYEEYFANLDARKVPKDKEYLNQYLSFMGTEQNTKTMYSKSKYMNTALKIAKDIGLSNIEYANVEMIIANMRMGSLKNADARKLYASAREKFEKEYDAGHFKIGEASFWLAQLERRRKKLKDAAREFERAIEILDPIEGEAAAAMVLYARKNGAAVYSELGDTETATKHIIAFAHKMPQETNRDLIDIYKPTPEFNNAARRAAKNGNYLVELSYDIDDKGFVHNIRLYSDTEEALNKPVIAALEKHRYVPLKVNGKLLPRKDRNYSFGYHVN